MAVRASYCHGRQGFTLSWLSGLQTVMVVRISYCYSFQGVILSWLSELYIVMVIRASYCHGCQSFILSRPTGLCTAMAICASYCHGLHGCQGCILSWLSEIILSWLSGLYAVMAVGALHGHGSPSLILSWAVRALYCHVRQGFALPWLSVPHTVTAYTAVRAVYCHGCQKLCFHGS